MASTGPNGSTWLLMANVTQGRLGVLSLSGQCCRHGYKCRASLSLQRPAPGYGGHADRIRERELVCLASLTGGWPFFHL